jgi:WD40 repeat protein
MEGLSSAAPKPSPEPFYTIRPHAGDVTSVEYLDLGTTGGLASGTGSGQLSVWRLSDKRQMWTQSCPAGITSVTRLGNTSDSLSVQLKGGVVTLWSIQTGKPGSSVTIKNPSFCRLSHFSSLVTTGQDSGGVFSSECFAVADRNYGRVNVYDCKTPKLVQTLSAENVKSRGMCMCVRAWCDGSTGIPLVLAGFDDGSLLLWDVRRPSAEMTALKLFPEPVMCLALDGEGRSGVCGSPGNSLEVFSLSTEKVL